MGDTDRAISISSWWQRGLCVNNSTPCRWCRSPEEEKTTQLEEPDLDGSSGLLGYSFSPGCTVP